MEERKVALITGGSKGIGKAIATKFASEDYNITLVARKIPDLESAKEEIQSQYGGIEVLIISADISSEEGSKSIVDQTVKRYGRIDVLINSAGIEDGSSFTEDSIKKLIDDHKKFQQVFDDGTFYPSVFARDQIIKNKGVIITIGSASGMEENIYGGQIHYAPQKSKANKRMQTWNLDLSQKGANAYSVAPGPIDTKLLRTLIEKNSDFVESATQKGGGSLQGYYDMILKPEDVADEVYRLVIERPKDSLVHDTVKSHSF